MRILHVPFCGGSLGKKGAEKSEAVIAALKEWLKRNMFSKELIVNKVDVDNNDIRSSFEHIQSNVENELKENEKVIVLGGDHSITYPCFKALSSHSNAGLIMLDAHPDCEETTDLASHEDFLRKLINDDLLKAEQCILIGLRSASMNEKEFLRSRGILHFDIEKMDDIGLAETCFTVMEQARNWDACYLSIDIDVVDPAFAPAVHYPEVGGLSGRELLFMLRKLLLLKNIKIVDLVEIIPEKDKDSRTISLGSQVLAEAISRMFPQYF